MLKYLLTYVPAKVIPGLINLISIMLYARIFTQHEYGEFSYILAMGVLIQGAIFPWIRMSLSRFIHENQESESNKNFLMNIYNLQYLITLLISVTLISLYFILNNNYLLIIVVIISSGSLVELIFAQLRADFKVSTFSILNIVRAFFKLLFTVILSIFLSNGIFSLIGGLLLSNVLVILILHKYLALFNPMEIYRNKEKIVEFLKYGLPLTFTFLMVIILSSTDRIFIKNFLGNSEVAQYTLAYDFSSFLMTNIIMIINLAYFPIIIRSYSQNLNYKIRLLEFSKLIFIASSMLLIVLISNSKYISEMIFGIQYDSNIMSKIIIIISITAFISGLKSYYFDIVFHISKNTKFQIIPVVTAALLNILLNWITIPRFGLDGALYSTLICYMIALIMSILIGRRLINIPIINANNIICVILIITITYSFNIIFDLEGVSKLIISTLTVAVIFSMYLILVERNLISRIVKGKVIDE